MKDADRQTNASAVRSIRRLRKRDLLEYLLEYGERLAAAESELGECRAKLAEAQELEGRLKARLDEKDAQIDHLKKRLEAKDVIIRAQERKTCVIRTLGDEATA